VSARSNKRLSTVRGRVISLGNSHASAIDLFRALTSLTDTPTMRVTGSGDLREGSEEEKASRPSYPSEPLEWSRVYDEELANEK